MVGLVEPPVAVYLLLEQPKVCFETSVEVAGRGEVKAILLRLLHLAEYGGAIVHCHMNNLLVLINVKELSVLINYQLVCRIDSPIRLLLFFSALARVEAVLHETGEDLRKLYFRTLLAFLTSQFRLDELSVESFVKEWERLRLVELSQILQREGHILPLVLFRDEALLGTLLPRFEQSEQCLLDFIITRHVDERGDPVRVDEEDATDVLFTDEALRHQHLL